MRTTSVTPKKKIRAFTPTFIHVDTSIGGTTTIHDMVDQTTYDNYIKDVINHTNKIYANENGFDYEFVKKDSKEYPMVPNPAGDIREFIILTKR